MHDRFPEVRAGLTEADHGGDLLRLLLEEELDLAFVRATELQPSFASVRLLTEPIVLVVAAASELAGRGAPTGPADIRSLGLIRHRMMSDLEPRLRELDIEPRYAIDSERSAAIHALVAAGVGAAIVPALSVDADDPRIRVHRLDHLIEPAVMRLAWLRGRQPPPAWSAFADLAERTVETIDVHPVPPALAAA
jgi:DNA-binding transcriptional LysR family regulator